MNLKIKTGKLFTMILALGAFLLLSAGCGKKEEAAIDPPIVKPVVIQDSPEPAPAASEEPTFSEANMMNGIPIIGEREVVDGKMQSYLTGEWKDEEVVTRRPLAVMVPNNSLALPQYGLSQASIIYEAPVEGRITRLMPVFEDYDNLDHIGPVRSSRDYYIYIASGYEAIYCNWGLAVPYVEKLINSDTIDNISAAVEGIHNPTDEAFVRIKRTGYSKEYTGYLLLDGFRKGVERRGYDWKYSSNFVPPFTFAADGTRAEYTDKPNASMIYPGGKGSNSSGYGVENPHFEYRKEDNLYYRYQNNKKQIDEMNGDQYAVSNVIFQYCYGEVRDAKDYLAFQVHGEGKALVFTNGKVIEGTWSRYDGDAVSAKFFDEEGNEIIMNQGKTWICNIWDKYSEHVLYE